MRLGSTGLNSPCLDALANDLREQLALLDIKGLDRLGDVRVAVMGAPEIERNFHEAMDLVVFVDVVGEPSRDDGGRIGASVLQGAHVLEGAGDGTLDRRPKQIGLAVEVVIDQRRIDVQSLGDVLDRHRGEVALGEKIERSGKEIVDAAGAVPVARYARLADILPRRACARSKSLLGCCVMPLFSDCLRRLADASAGRPSDRRLTARKTRLQSI